MNMKVLFIPLVVGLALIGVVGYSAFRPTAAPSAPIQSQLAPTESTRVGENTRAFTIVPEESEARFMVDEILNGSPKTVVGTTNQVAGHVAVDHADLDAAQVGNILINARTFTTDSGARNRAIQNFILQTDQHEYITFSPTAIVDAPPTLNIGETVRFQIPGNLTIRGETRPVTFDAVVTPQSADRLQGSATTTIRYSDWGISIPQVPAVTGVAETVQLGLAFVATAA